MLFPRKTLKVQGHWKTEGEDISRKYYTRES